jgi:hypothetical protein
MSRTVTKEYVDRKNFRTSGIISTWPSDDYSKPNERQPCFHAATTSRTRDPKYKQCERVPAETVRTQCDGINTLLQRT